MRLPSFHREFSSDRSTSRLSCWSNPSIVWGFGFWASWLTLLSGCHLSRAETEPQLEAKSPIRVRTAATPAPSVAPTVEAPVASDAGPLLHEGPRRNVIIVIGDGMQLAHEIATSRYLHGVDRGLSFHEFPVRSYKTTWDVTNYNQRAANLGPDVALYSPESFDPKIGYDPEIGGVAPYPIEEDNEARRGYFLSGIYPDSASTATAMSAGIKTLTAVIGWRPDLGENGAIEESTQYLRRTYGMSVGFVTTVPISHATPAGFFAHNQWRDNYWPIAHELMTVVRPEVMISGGWEHSNYYDPADLDTLVASGDYVFVHREDGVSGNQALLSAAVLAKQTGKRLLGMFGQGDGNFPSPVPIDNPGNPQISPGSLESPSLEAASIAALEVLSQDPQGFFLLVEQGDIDWANHNHDYARMVGCVSDLDSAVRGIVGFVDRPGDAIDWSNTTILVTADHANSYLRFVKTPQLGDLPTQDGGNYPEGDVTYGEGHTAELVTVYAKGFAATRVHHYETPYPGLGIIDDTSIYRLTLDATER